MRKRWWSWLMMWGVITATVAAEPPPVDLLMIGHFVDQTQGAALDNLIAEAKKHNINIYFNEKGFSNQLSDFTPELLRKFQVVVYSGAPGKNTRPTNSGEEQQTFVRMLKAYGREGGGIIWTPLAYDSGAHDWTKNFGQEFGATAVEEDLYDDSSRLIDIRPTANAAYFRYYYTDNLTRDPLTAGVRGLLLPVIGDWSWPGTVPMKFDPTWKVLLRAAETTRTVGNTEPSGSGQPKFSPEKPGSCGPAPALVAVRDRQDGYAGRMAVWPFYLTHTFLNTGSRIMGDVMMLNGFNGKPSDGWKLFANLVEYVAEPARQAGFGGFRTTRKPVVSNVTPMNWAAERFDPALWSTNAHHRRAYRGLIGAQTELSGGKGSVAEWVKAAKAAGLDFLFFLEDVARLDQDKLDQLVADCKKYTDETFLCSPGFRARDTLDTPLFFSEVYKMPEARNLTPDKRIKSYGEVINQHSWQNIMGLYNLSSMKIDPQYHFLVCAASPWSYRGTQLVDDGLEAYWKLEGSGHNYVPCTVVELDDPARLPEVLKTVPTTVVYGSKIQDVVDEFRRRLRHPAGSYLTTGPSIDFWGVINASANVFRPGAANMRLKLAVSDPQGLESIELVDLTDHSLYRRFKPNGAKQFEIVIDDTIGRQRVIAPYIVGKSGRALAQPMMTFHDGNRLWLMSDRLMGMIHSHIWNRERTRLLQAGGNLHGITWIKKDHNNAGGAPSTYRADTENVVYGIDGGRFFPAACDISPWIETADGVREPGTPAYRFRNRLASFDQAVMDYDGSLQFSGPIRKLDPEFHWQSYNPVLPMTNATIMVRAWAVRPRLEGIGNVNVHQAQVTFLRDTRLRRVRLFGLRRNDRGTDCTYSLSDEAGKFSETMPLSSKWRRLGSLPVGGYLYPAGEPGGAVGVINLGPGAIQYDANVFYTQVFFDGKDRLFRAGETLTFTWMVFFLNYPQPPAAAVEKLIADYGLSGGKPGYPLEVKQGKLLSTQFEAVFAPENGGVTLNVGQYDLVNNLPLRLTGIPANSVVGRYDLDTKQLLILAPFEGGLRSAVNTNLKATRLYLGELLHFDNPAIITGMVQDAADHLKLELHNPTDEPQRVTMTGRPGFPPLAGENRTFTLPPCSSEKVEFTLPPGSLDYTTYTGDL